MNKTYFLPKTGCELTKKQMNNPGSNLHVFGYFSILILVFLASSQISYLAAQGKVMGLVIETGTNNAVPFANVELLKSADSVLVHATVAGSDGKFMFGNVNHGNYLIRISSLGYRKLLIPEFEISARKPEIQFGPSLLIPEAQSLAEITVYGQKLTGQIEDGKTVYTIRSKSAETAQSGLDILRQLPDVTVGILSDEVTLAGSTNVLYQVNGRKVDHSFLLQLNPSLIEKIEVITVPGAKYDSNVDAIINILLKRNMELGLSARVRLQAPLSGTLLTKNNANMDVYYKKLRFFVAANYKFSRYKVENTNERIALPSNEVISSLRQAGTNTNKGTNAGFNYGFDYFPNEKNAISMFSSIQPAIPNRNTTLTSNSYVHGQTLLNTLTSSFVNDKNTYADLSLYYKHIFGKNHELSFENFVSNRNSTRTNEFYDQEYVNENLLSTERTGWTDQETIDRNKQMALRLDYMVPLSSSIRLTSGYNGFFIRSGKKYNERIEAFSDELQYSENRQVLYSNLLWSKGTFNIQGGARFEHSDIEISHAYDTSNVYNYFFPSASIGYKGNDKHTFSLNYRKSVIRPSINHLSPINYSDDSYRQSVGNPRLRPGIINRIEFTHRIQLNKSVYVSYMPYFSLIRNDIRQVLLPGTDSVSRYKYANAGKAQELGLTISANAGVSKWWMLSYSFTWFNRELSALPEYGIASKANKSSYRMNASSQIILPGEWVFLVEYNYNGPFVDVQTTTHSYYECILGLNKSFKKRLNIFIFTLNPWNSKYTYDHKTMTSAGMVQTSREALKYSYILLVRLGYNFRSGKEGKRLDRDHTTDEVQPAKKGVL